MVISQVISFDGFMTVEIEIFLLDQMPDFNTQALYDKIQLEAVY